MEDEITVTLVNSDTGESETIPFPLSTSVRQVQEVGQAVFQLSSATLRKDGRLIHGETLQEAGVVNGDLIAVEAKRMSSASVPPHNPRGGDLDFSHLLATGSAASASTSSAAAGNVGGGGLDFSGLLGGPSASSTSQPSAPVYYPNINLNEAIAYNPHPETFVSPFYDSLSRRFGDTPSFWFAACLYPRVRS